MGYIIEYYYSKFWNESYWRVQFQYKNKNLEVISQLNPTDNKWYPPFDNPKYKFESEELAKIAIERYPHV